MDPLGSRDQSMQCPKRPDFVITFCNSFHDLWTAEGLERTGCALLLSSLKHLTWSPPRVTTPKETVTFGMSGQQGVQRAEGGPIHKQHSKGEA